MIAPSPGIAEYAWHVSRGFLLTGYFLLLLVVLLSVLAVDHASAQPVLESRGNDQEAAILPCPGPHLEMKSWTLIQQKHFTFSVPPEFRELKVRGFDSWGREFHAPDSSVSVGFSWGPFSNPLKGPDMEGFQHFDACEQEIGGRTARIVTLWPLGSGFLGESPADNRYAAGATWRDVAPKMRLTMFGWARDRKGLDQLLQIVRTVKFE